MVGQQGVAGRIGGDDTLKEALLQADERLYLVKQKRKKDVAKHH